MEGAASQHPASAWNDRCHGRNGPGPLMAHDAWKCGSSWLKVHENVVLNGWSRARFLIIGVSIPIGQNKQSFQTIIRALHIEDYFFWLQVNSSYRRLSLSDEKLFRAEVDMNSFTSPPVHGQVMAAPFRGPRYQIQSLQIVVKYCNALIRKWYISRMVGIQVKKLIISSQRLVWFLPIGIPLLPKIDY